MINSIFLISNGFSFYDIPKAFGGGGVDGIFPDESTATKLAPRTDVAIILWSLRSGLGEANMPVMKSEKKTTSNFIFQIECFGYVKIFSVVGLF